MVGIQDLIDNDVTGLHEYFELIVCLYINNEPGERKKALKLYGLLDSQQKADWNEFLKDGSFPYSIADEIEEFLEDNVKAF